MHGVGQNRATYGVWHSMNDGITIGEHRCEIDVVALLPRLWATAVRSEEPFVLLMVSCHPVSDQATRVIHPMYCGKEAQATQDISVVPVAFCGEDELEHNDDPMRAG